MNARIKLRTQVYCTSDLKRLPMQADTDRRNNRVAILVCTAILGLMMLAGYLENAV